MESRPPEALGAVSHVLRPSMARVEICTFAMFCKSFRAVYFFLVSAQCGGAALGRNRLLVGSLLNGRSCEGFRMPALHYHCCPPRQGRRSKTSKEGNRESEGRRRRCNLWGFESRWRLFSSGRIIKDDFVEELGECCPRCPARAGRAEDVGRGIIWGMPDNVPFVSLILVCQC